MRILLVAAAVLAAGCLSPPAERGAPASLASSTVAIDLPEPMVLEWSGVVLHSDLPGHVRPTEDALWPVHQEGFLLHVEKVPEVLEVSVEWEGDSEFLIMLHSHKAEGTNAYVEHISEMDATRPKCIRVPTADLAEGHWQVMIHTNAAVNVPYTLRVGLLGGAAAVDDSDRHGHWMQDGGFEVEEHETEPCGFLVEPGSG